MRTPEQRAKQAEYHKEWRRKNAESYNQKKKEWETKNYDRRREQERSRYQENREEIVAKKVAYNRIRLDTDPQHRIADNLRSRLRRAICSEFKTGSAVQDLGCSIEFLKKHLEAQFSEGMSWQNYGPEWHIDHIRPLASFDLTDREEFLKAAHYTNLQPLWKLDNLQKGSRYSRAG